MKGEQQSLFELDPAPWEVDDAADELAATVVFATGPQKPFDYRVSAELAPRLTVGQRVRAPFGAGNRSVVGYCVRLEHRPAGGRRLKDLAGVVDERTLLSPPMLRLTEWMADYYLCGWGQVLEAVVPAGVRDRPADRVVQMVSLSTQVAARLAELKLTAVQSRILHRLASYPVPVAVRQLANEAGCTTGPIHTLAKRGLVEISEGRAATVAGPAELPPESHLTLNAEQQTALDTILAALNSGDHETVLVHGVTGSGKTEVYLQAIAEVLRFGRQAIVLVPEISLTPQTEARFRSRFGAVAVLHSHMTDVERRVQWERIAEGRARVVIGAHGAFAPTPNLGIIVLDEEHETTFKQETAPRYHARDVAAERCRAEGVPLVLGSATPALESWHRAQQGDYRLVSLPRRVFDRPMPAVGTIDLRLESRDRISRGSISRQLHQAMGAALRDGGQVILLLNRRGYSTHIQCPACGEVVECPHCAIALTHHVQGHIAVCHYCDYQVEAPDKCPKCDFAGIRYGGLGTQRLEAEVRARFPENTCLRMDTDTMQQRGSHASALAKFRDGEVQILLGTQMIAKGLDFPNVTLVGVINADTALHLPDFRASERTFQLVTQVAGRTGRGEKGGRVLVQTFDPENAAIKAAVKHDYGAFAAHELPTRKRLDYPPFASMIRIVVRGSGNEVTSQFAATIAARIRAALEKAECRWRVLGPAPAPIGKLRGQYRFQIQTQASDLDNLRTAVRAAMDDLKNPDDVQWIVDVDPSDMM